MYPWDAHHGRLDFEPGRQWDDDRGNDPGLPIPGGRRLHQALRYAAWLADESVYELEKVSVPLGDLKDKV